MVDYPVLLPLLSTLTPETQGYYYLNHVQYELYILPLRLMTFSLPVACSETFLLLKIFLWPTVLFKIFCGPYGLREL